MGDDVSTAGLLRDLGELVEQQRVLHARLDNRDDLIRSLADRVLHLAASGEKSTEALLLVRQRLTEIHEQREYIRAGQEEILRKLAVISKDVDDVERAAREATGQHPLAVADPYRSAAEPVRPAVRELVAAFREAPIGLKTLLVVLALLVAGHAELAMLLKYLFGS